MLIMLGQVTTPAAVLKLCSSHVERRHTYLGCGMMLATSMKRYCLKRGWYLACMLYISCACRMAGGEGFHCGRHFICEKRCNEAP